MHPSILASICLSVHPSTHPLVIPFFGVATLLHSIQCSEGKSKCPWVEKARPSEERLVYCPTLNSVECRFRNWGCFWERSGLTEPQVWVARGVHGQGDLNVLVICVSSSLSILLCSCSETILFEVAENNHSRKWLTVWIPLMDVSLLVEWGQVTITLESFLVDDSALGPQADL